MTLVDTLAIGLRALGFISALQAAGLAIFRSLFEDNLSASKKAVQALAFQSAAAGVLMTLAYQIVEPARMMGALSGVLDGSMQAMLLRSDVGATHAIRIVGLAMIALVAFKANRLSQTVALMGATLVAVSFAFMGHTATDEQRWLLAGSLTLHVLIVAFWFGALVPLYLATRHEAVSENGRLIEEFSSIATWLVPLIFVAGIVMMLSLLPSLANLQTAYGFSVLSKVAGFSVLMAAAAANKWRLGPRIVAGEVDAQNVFRRVVLLEWLLIAAVLTITAVMTSLFSPDH